MRVIAGSLKGHRLKVPSRRGVRPTLGRVKEALFSAIESLLRKGGRENLWEELIVLDLYAGTGALGIEALSRGAARADFIDSSQLCCQTIRENLAKLGLQERGAAHCWRIRGAITESFARRLGRSYDIIFADAPYRDTNLMKLVESVIASTLVKGDSVFIVEHSRSIQVETTSLPMSQQWDMERREYGDTALSVFRFHIGRG